MGFAKRLAERQADPSRMKLEVGPSWPGVEGEGAQSSKSAVASAPGAARVRVWNVMSGCSGPPKGRPPPEGANVVYAPARRQPSHAFRPRPAKRIAER